MVVYGRPDRPPARRPSNRRENSGHKKHTHREKHDPKNATATTIIRLARTHTLPPGPAITASNQRMATSGVPVNRRIDPGPARLDRRVACLVNQALNSTQSARRGHQDNHALRRDRALLIACSGDVVLQQLVRPSAGLDSPYGCLTEVDPKARCLIEVGPRCPFSLDLRRHREKGMAGHIQ
jgi:hypothetical protein